jgi:hypothetical protein
MLFSSIADNKNPNSLASSFRSKRLNLFKGFVAGLPKPVKILDIGGTPEFWKNAGLDAADVEITLLNLSLIETDLPNVVSIVGNATDLSAFADKTFDIAFSNSVIEHLFSFQNQQKMAQEAQRVSTYHFIQTPNFWFPIEPHWLFPCFQYLPKAIRVFLTRCFNLGHLKRSETWAAARQQVEEIQLLSRAEMDRLFPESTIWEEKLLIFSKSFVAHNFKG